MLVQSGVTKQFNNSVLSEDIYVQAGGTLILTNCNTSRIAIYSAGTITCLGNVTLGKIYGYNGQPGNLNIGGNVTMT